MKLKIKSENEALLFNALEIIAYMLNALNHGSHIDGTSAREILLFHGFTNKKGFWIQPKKRDVSHIETVFDR